MKRKNCFQTAEYIRLSKEDGDKAESDSIGNQRKLINEYIKEKAEFVRYDTYVDDGYTGTNFNRPAFRRMIGDIEAGKVNCVIVKDLSRFGRDYIDTGRYLERYFPDRNVRFISITDNIDSFEQAYDMLLPIKNIFKNMSYSGREFRYFTLFRQICVQQSHFVSFLQGIVCLSVGYVSICCVLSKKGNSPCWCRA